MLMSELFRQRRIANACWSIFENIFKKQYELYDTEKRDVRVRWLILPITCHFLSLRFPHQGKGEAVRRAEAHFSQAARSRGRWAALPLPENTAGADKKAQGLTVHLSDGCFCCFMMLFFPFGSLKPDECCILTFQICVSPNETLLLQLSSRKKKAA